MDAGSLAMLLIAIATTTVLFFSLDKLSNN